MEDTTIRDFGGGWNTADSDLNLSSKYQPVSENIARGVDGSFSPRMGYTLFNWFEDGFRSPPRTFTTDYKFYVGQPYIDIHLPDHPYKSGDHFHISNIVGYKGEETTNISADDIEGTYGIVSVDENTVRIALRYSAQDSGQFTFSVSLEHDTHTLSGNIIHMHYFNDRMIVFSDSGEIATIADDGTRENIWNYKAAYEKGVELVPTRPCKMWSSDTFKSTVIACNGRDNDKPIQINSDFKCEYLVDKASNSNAAVPRAEYVLCMQGYVLLLNTEHGEPYVEISAKGTDGTFTRDPTPDDAVEKDLSMETSTVKASIRGATRLRDKVFVAFFDRGMVGTLGIYSDKFHDPDFGDTISEHGTVSHRTLVPLGNDVFMCDYAGVPSVSISQQSGIYVPTRVSELISPTMQSHLASLSEQILQEKAFAVYNKSSKSYMLFLPKYDGTARGLAPNALVFTPALRELNRAIVIAPMHNLLTKTTVRLQGATDIGTLQAAKINGTRKVVSIIDENHFVVQLDGAPTNLNVVEGGGDAMTFTPINDETPCYVFEYNKELGIRRWTRYRDFNFDCAASSQRGRVYVAKGLRVYRLGDHEEPVFADRVGEFDYWQWFNNETYYVGERVRDETNSKVYICLETHTSSANGSFAQFREKELDIWEEYEGEEIEWELQTPWSDLRKRANVKVNKYVQIDATGRDRFTLSAFTNNILIDPETFELAPYRSMDFTAGDVGGFGMPKPNYFGGGRRTREQKLWPMPVRGKLIRWRISGKTKLPVKFVALTMYYKIGGIK